MKDELTSLLAVFHKVQESGGQATLSAVTNNGKTKIKLEIVSPPTISATGVTSLPATSSCHTCNR